jgi:hypothetical protein
MNGEDKKRLYDFLCTSEEYLNGYASPRKVQEFPDDLEEGGAPSPYPVVIAGSEEDLGSDERDLLSKMLRSIGLALEHNCGWAPSLSNLTQAKPVMALALGEAQGSALLGQNMAMEALRESLHDCGGIPLMVTYHPRSVLLDGNLKRPVWEDLKKFKQELESRIGALPPLPGSA